MPDRSDFFIGDLRRHIQILDDEIQLLTRKIDVSIDPISDGLCDRAEYFIGAGFVAFQKYILESFVLLNLNQTEALGLGPSLIGESTFAQIVWAAANYWKHEAEWWSGAIDVRPLDNSELREVHISWPSGGKPQGNVRHLETFGSFGRDFICANVLSELVAGSELQLKHLFPLLEDWRTKMENLPRSHEKGSPGDAGHSI